MAVIKPIDKNTIGARTLALSPLNLYLERVRSVSDGVRMKVRNFSYIPLQFGGIKGQQQSLLANSVVKLIDFKVD